MDKLSLRYRITLSRPADLTYADCMHRLVPFDVVFKKVRRRAEAILARNRSWAYLYRAVDSAGETIEFMLSPKRDLVRL